MKGGGFSRLVAPPEIRHGAGLSVTSIRVGKKGGRRNRELWIRSAGKQRHVDGAVQTVLLPEAAG